MNSYWTEAAQLYLILHQSCFSLKSDHQDLLRSVCFQKLYFHCSSAEEWSSSHIFWGAFISSSLNQHCIICLDHFNLILLRHIIGDIEWQLIYMHFMYLLFVHINIRICTKLHILAQFEPEVFSHHILTISDYMSQKRMYQIWYKA